MLNVPYIPKEKIAEKAENFLDLYWEGIPPVDVEVIAEYGMGIRIRPLPGFKDRFSGDGLISRDGNEIRLDFDQAEVRIRFTVAHELGHRVLHKSFIDSLPSTRTSEEWMNLYEQLADEVRDRMDIQASIFAANVLMPIGPLQQEFNGLLPQLLPQVQEANEAGIFRHDYLEAVQNVMAGKLARIFNVSQRAMFNRLTNTGLVDDIP